ncbi:RNA polymerase sigma factor [Hyalangium versicolor]|uniref:RNA polymerase sigma factor n=1 Tax=Hyalangium versicolor TaxID=2861190 RepID=UPI001CCC4ED1|nr:sigma-70 family RNA polymerase sigma factor [Hyalangium versicolor]
MPKLTESIVPLSAPPTGIQEWYRQHLSFVYRSLERLGIPPADLEDLAHDVFMVAHQRWDSFDRSSPVRPWLFGIAVKVASGAQHRAWRTREVPTETYPEMADRHPLPDALAERAQQQRKLLRALDTLDMDRRAIFVLHDLQGVAVPEAAHALGIPLNTAYSRLRAARLQVAEALRHLGHPGGER